MLDRKLLIGVSFVLLWTCYDLNRSYFNATSKVISSPSGDDNVKNTNHEDISSIPPPKMKMQMARAIKFHYCHSCGYRKVFEQFSELVRTNYPTMAVIGENYPPPPIKSLLARVLSIIKMALLVCILCGQNPFSRLHIPTPTVYLWAIQNKIYACLMIFFFSNSLESYLVSTGAFEISIDDVPLWSKIGTGRLPSANEFVQMLQTFGTNINPNSHTSPTI